MTTMEKLVELRLDGDSDALGFQVTLRIRQAGNYLQDSYTSPSEIEVTGYLPPSPELATQLQHHWQENYRSLGAPYRIKPKKITYDGSVNAHVQECKESAQKLRSHLTTWLDSESFRPINNHLREELNRDEKIRFLIRTENQQLKKLPWHLWDFFERYRQAEVALSPVTYERPPQATNTTHARVKILAILGHSEGINTDADRQLLENLPHAETTFLVEKTRQEINEQLWAQPWDILFFAGHSETAGETGRIYINPTESLTIDELWYALRKAVERGLKIAIFNSCDGLGLAQQLHDVQIPQMIVMRELVPDKVAQEFLKYFLTSFAGGQSFYLAVREARERLEGLESEFPCASWLPVICQNLAEVPPVWNGLFAPEIVVSEPIYLPKRRKLRKLSLQKLLIASIGASCLVMGMRSFGLLQSLELHTFDKMMQLRPDENLDERLLIVEVTKQDTDRLNNQHPLHDQTMLQLLKKLNEYKPTAIGINIFRDNPVGNGQADLRQYLQQNKHIFPVCFHSDLKNKEIGIQPPDGISEKQVGFIDVTPDLDEVIRRHLFSLTQNKSSCNSKYSLSFKLANDYLQTKGYSFKNPSSDTWKIGSIEFKILKGNSGFYQDKKALYGHQILLNYRSYNSSTNIAKSVTLTEVLNNKVPQNLVGDKIIFIGVTDKNLYKDEFNTPYNQENKQEIRGLMLHAQMVSQIISAVENGRHLLWFLPLWGESLWVLGWCLVGGILAWCFQLLINRMVAVVSGVIVLWGISFVGLLANGVVLPIIPSILALVATAEIVAKKNQN